jgi:DNA polymerase-3 subunit epsilon
MRSLERVQHIQPESISVTSALEWYKLPVPRFRYFCSLALARATWPKLPSHSLTSLGKHFKIVYQAHNALADAETCGKIVNLATSSLGAQAIKELLAKAGMKIKSLRDKNSPSQYGR